MSTSLRRRLCFVCLLSTLSLVALTGCDQSRSTGEMLDGKPHGVWHYWYASGQREKTGTYQNGVEDGQWTYWYENGQKMKSGPYRAGKLDGKWTFWFDDGQKEKEGQYENGQEQGDWVHFHQNGQRSQLLTYLDGRHQASKTWDPRGKAEVDPRLNKELDGLIEDLKNRSSSVSEAAAARLSSMGASAVPALAEMLREQTSSHQINALKVLRKIGKGLEPEADKLIPVLVDCVNDQNANVREQAMFVFLSLGPRSVPFLATVMKKGTPQGQVLAASGLGQFGASAAPAIPELVAALSSNEFLRAAASDALGGIGAPAVPALDELLKNPSSGNFERLYATKALHKIGADAAPAAPALVGMLSNGGIRNEATQALAKIGAPAVPPLIAAMQEEKNDTLRTAAGTALARIGEPAATAVAELLKNPAKKVRIDAATTLADLGPKAKAAIPAIQAQQKVETDSDVNDYLERALTRIGSR